MGCLQMWKTVSNTEGKPLIWLPLSAVLFITALKDLFEDLKRHSSDRRENTRKVLIKRDGRFVEDEW